MTIELPDGTPHTFTDEELERGEAMMARLREVEASLVDDTGQTAYSEMLLPCPFCGGEAKEFTGEDAAPHRWTVECGRCGAHVGSDTRHKARAKWNRRAERTCRDLNPPSCRDFECSECGESNEFTPGFMPNYCPNCGARVVEEEK